MTDEEEQEAIRLYLSGKTLKEVGELLFRNEHTLIRVLKDAGIDRRRTGGPEKILSASEKEIILLRWEEKVSLGNIARELHTDEFKVSSFLKSLGFDSSKKRRKVERVIGTEGYASVADPTGKRRYVLEHRLVMEQSLGRPLEEHETVHHIDGDKLNNDLSNLQLRAGRHGKGVSLRCLDCGSQNIESTKLAVI